MKTYKIILSCFWLSTMLISCQKFVDIKKSSSQVLLSTANDCQLLLDNYSIMNSNYPIDGEISSDDYFINGASYQAANMPQEEKNLYTWLPGAQRALADPSWQNPYKVVYNANLVLETEKKLEGGNDNPLILNNIKGSALFFRAYAHWHIAQLYANAYSKATASQDPGIPIRLSSDINGKSSRGTVQSTYDQILQDLNDALTLLQPTSSIASRPNKAAAYAMLARTYLSMEDYPNALINANAALALNNQLLNYNSISKISATPFARYNKEVIFHSITYRNSVVAVILAPGIASSNTAKIDPVLAASYDVNDLRRQIFLKSNTGVHAGTFRFTGNYEPTTLASFFNGLAVDELMLIRAECYARANRVPEAMTELNNLLRTRWLSTVTYPELQATTVDNALNIILAERRKELLMRGLRWIDLRRLNKDPRFKKDLQRTVTTGIAPNLITTSYTLPANDLRYTLLIPQEVINFSGIAQNPR